MTNNCLLIRLSGSCVNLNPKISVILPVYSGISFLNRAISSLIKSRFSGELLIIENGSTEIDLEKIYFDFEIDFDIKYFHIVNNSVSSARNLGIRQATFSVLTFLDVDDEFNSNRLNHVSSAIPNQTFVIGTQEIRSEGNELGTSIKARINALGVPAYHPITIIAAKVDLERIGGFDENIGHGGDLDLIARLISIGLKPCYVDEVFVVRHFHTLNLTNQILNSRKGMYTVLRKHVKGVYDHG